MEERIEFMHMRRGGWRSHSLGLVLISGDANECGPVDALEMMDKFIDGGGRGRGLQHLRRDAFPQQGAAFRHAAKHAARHLGMLPEQFEHGDRLGAHLEDAPVGVAAAEQAQKGAEFDLRWRATAD